MLTVQYAHDIDSNGFTVFCISPGWLRTDLGGADADLTPDLVAKAAIYMSAKIDNGAIRNTLVASEQAYSGNDPPY